MKLAIMQPYFLPYIGYFQLIAAVDMFIVYDNIKYTKKGWINRNRMLVNNTSATFSLPLRKGADSLDIAERELATDFDREKLLNRFRGAYTQAPYFSQTMPLLERIVRNKENNLFKFIHGSIIEICKYLGIETSIATSSEIAIDHRLKGQDKVLALCTAVRADTYINPIGGTGLYSRDAFKVHGIELKFIRPKPLHYEQFGNSSVPWLSIVDVLMFNSRQTVSGSLLDHYEWT